MANLTLTMKNPEDRIVNSDRQHVAGLQVLVDKRRQQAAQVEAECERLEGQARAMILRFRKQGVSWKRLSALSGIPVETLKEIIE